MPRITKPKAPPFAQESINGESMFALRKILGMSQTEFYNPAGVSQFSSSRYENNSREIPYDTRIALSFVWQRAIRENADLIDVRK